ncbi:MAG: MFS transporter [Deinococcales bacterium]|nr:MFS transporter [Deinococcales bacterium]
MILLATTKLRVWLKNLFPGWWVLGAAVAVQILPAGLLFNAYSAYAVVMQTEFGWSATIFAAAFAANQATGFLGPFQGWLLQRFGPQRIIRIGLVVFAIGLVMLSQVHGLPLFFTAVVIASFGASLGGFLAPTTAVVNWFIRHRSMALALLQVALSAGGLIAPVIAWSLTTYGWRFTAIASAVLVLAIGLPLTRAIRDRPEDIGLTPDGDTVEEQQILNEKPQAEFSAREAIRTRAFWFISLGHALALTVVSAVLAHLMLYLTQEKGFSLAFGASMVAVMTASSLVGQLSGGLLGYRVEKRLIAIAAMFGHSGALCMLVFGGSLPWIIAFAILHGLSWGLRAPIMQALRADYFGRHSFGQVLGLASPLITSGMVAGPLIVGLLADKSGSFQPGFLVVASLAALGSIFFIFTHPPKKRSSVS